MPRHQGVWGEEWNDCQRCGFEHPVSLLTMQKGLRVCTCHGGGCLDDLSNYYRQKQIAEILRQPDGRSDQGEIFRQPQEITF